MPVLTVPMRAIGKGRPRFGNGRTWTPAATKQAENAIACLWAAEHGNAMLDGTLRMIVRAEYEPPASWSAKKRQESWGQLKPTKPDCDNVFKLVADALEGVAYANDARIADAGVSKRYGPEDRLTITVEAIGAMK